MNTILAAWNAANETEALEAMLVCCGARRWAAAMVALRPVSNVEELSAAADQAWETMEEADWREAFACHPRIGEQRTRGKAADGGTRAAHWSRQEQLAVKSAIVEVLDELAECNALYERRFGFTYIVCATGRSAEEMLAILKRRLANSREAELREAAEQQRQIMQIRLGKWLME